MCITQWIYFIISFRSSIRRKRMSFFAFASIYDISRDRFCRRDVRNLRAKNARYDASMRHCASLRTIRRRSCERSFLRLHRHLQRRLQFRLIWHFSLSFRSHHFVSFFIAYRLIRNTQHIRKCIACNESIKINWKFVYNDECFKQFHRMFCIVEFHDHWFNEIRCIERIVFVCVNDVV